MISALINVGVLHSGHSSESLFHTLENCLWDRMIRRGQGERRTFPQIILQRARFLGMENILQGRMIRRGNFGASE